jgi:sulfate adenylyltransferase subunit 1 (EFTu-like GTPase family)
MKLKKTLNMLAFVKCGEGDPEMTTLVGDYLEDFIKFVRDKLFPLHNEICKVAGLLSLGV